MHTRWVKSRRGQKPWCCGETWCSHHHGNMVGWLSWLTVDGYKLLRRDMQGRRGGGMPLYIREYFNCVELKDSDGKAECLWVHCQHGRDMANKAVILRGVSYGPPCQDKEADEVFCKQQGDVSQWLVPVLVRDFNLLDICVPRSVFLLCFVALWRARWFRELSLWSWKLISASVA